MKHKIPGLEIKVEEQCKINRKKKKKAKTKLIFNIMKKPDHFLIATGS